MFLYKYKGYVPVISMKKLAELVLLEIGKFDKGEIDISSVMNNRKLE